MNPPKTVMNWMIKLFAVNWVNQFKALNAQLCTSQHEPKVCYMCPLDYNLRIFSAAFCPAVFHSQVHRCWWLAAKWGSSFGRRQNGYRGLIRRAVAWLCFDGREFRVYTTLMACSATLSQRCWSIHQIIFGWRTLAASPNMMARHLRGLISQRAKQARAESGESISEATPFFLLPILVFWAKSTTTPCCIGINQS